MLRCPTWVAKYGRRKATNALVNSMDSVDGRREGDGLRSRDSDLADGNEEVEDGSRGLSW